MPARRARGTKESRVRRGDRVLWGESASMLAIDARRASAHMPDVIEVRAGAVALAWTSTFPTLEIQ